MAFADTAVRGQALYGYGLLVMFIDIEQGRSYIKISAGRLFGGTAANGGCESEAVHFGAERCQKAVHRSLVQSLFTVEFLKKPGYK